MNIFQFNDFFSNDIGLIVKNLPDFGKAEKNIEIVEVPGRSGTLHFDHDTHKAYKTSFDCYCRYEYLSYLYSILNGKGKLIFNDEAFYHDVYVYEKVKETYFSRDIVEINIPIEVQPYATDIQESTAYINSETMLTYQGDVKVCPYIVVSGSRRHHIVLGDTAFTVDCTDHTIFIDCENIYLTDESGDNANGYFEGIIPCIVPGDQLVINDGAEIKLRWNNKWMR